MSREAAVAKLLVRRGQALFSAPPVPVQFADHQAADALINDLHGHPHAFVLACIMDRQVKAERAWRLPRLFAERVGGFEFERLRRLSQKDVYLHMTQPTSLHRLNKGMAEAFHAAILRIADRYGGDAASIWRGTPSSADVVLRFLEFRGVGPKIATMATNILARDFKVPLADYYSVDISADVHMRRVFTRLGLVQHGASTDELIYRARAMHPEFPGLMDFPTWEIGRTWCKAKAPRCKECYMQGVCPTANGSVLAASGEKPYRVALVACVKSKRSSAAPAKDLYVSPLFRGMRAYAEANADAWYILSAEYGLLDPDQVVAPYERTLRKMPKRDRAAWVERVQGELMKVLPANAEVTLLAGERYREGVERSLRTNGFAVHVPMQGLSFGKQLQWLGQHRSGMDGSST